jgi:MFS family permease
MTRTRSSTVWTFAITAVALFMVALDNLVVTTALPVIRRDLGASLQDLEWMVNAYTLTFAVLLLTGAALGDRFGRRRLFVLGLAVFTVGSAAAALAPSSSALILARATSSAVALGASAAAAEASVKTPMPIEKSSRRPKRSPSAAPVRSSTANVSVYALTVHSSWLSDAPRSSRMTGSAVVTTRLSSVTMKSATDVIANVQIVL